MLGAGHIWVRHGIVARSATTMREASGGRQEWKPASQALQRLLCPGVPATPPHPGPGTCAPWRLHARQSMRHSVRGHGGPP